MTVAAGVAMMPGSAVSGAATTGSAAGAAGFAVLTRRGAGIAGAAGFAGSAALPPGFLSPPLFAGPGVSANDAFVGILMFRCRACFPTNSRATTSSIVLDAVVLFEKGHDFLAREVEQLRDLINPDCCQK